MQYLQVFISPISIRAPARGATDEGCICFGTSMNFNPRSREGSDDHVIAIMPVLGEISIRAPARGATYLNGIR